MDVRRVSGAGGAGGLWPVGSRLSGNATACLARTGFLVTASLATAALYWVYHRLDQTATTLVVVGSLAYLSIFTLATDRLVEDNAPPPPADPRRYYSHSRRREAALSARAARETHLPTSSRRRSASR